MAQNAIMCNPTLSPFWDFNLDEAWFGVPLFFFKMKVNTQTGAIKEEELAFVRWLHVFHRSVGEYLLYVCNMNIRCT